MGKKVVLIGRKPLETALTFGLIKDSSSYLHYRTLDDFSKEKKDMYTLAFQKAIENKELVNSIPESNILNIINMESSIQGLHEKTLKQSISTLDSDSKLLNKWEVVTNGINMETQFDNIIDIFKKSKICVIDTTIYNLPSLTINPYLFFCLGLGHGMQREVIPLTNTARKANLPFDVRGLYHIFFNNLDMLKGQFINIFPKLDKAWDEEKDNLLFAKLWDPFLKNDCLQIMTCGRNTQDARGDRTNIDKWDFMTVSQLTNYLGRKYPNAEFEVTTPISKYTESELKEIGVPQIVADVKTEIYDKNCIIIGSSDVSDLAEVLLAEIHKFEPYSSGERRKNKGYVLIKDIVPPKSSSCYWIKEKGEKEGVCSIDKESGEKVYYSNEEKDAEGKIYGILVIANNPFVSPNTYRKIMIYAGFSGPATYGISKLLTDEKFKKQLKKLNKYHDISNNFEAIIRVKYKIDKTLKGDNRIFDDQMKSCFLRDVTII